MKNIYSVKALVFTVLCLFSFKSNACHLVTMTETSAVDNGNGTFTYVFNICMGAENTYGFWLDFTGANLITYPGSTTGPTTGNTINASVPPTSGTGDIEYGNWDSNAGVLFSGTTNDCVSMSFTFDGPITRADVGGTQAFYIGGPCAGTTTTSSCFASLSSYNTYTVTITPTSNNNQNYTFRMNGIIITSGAADGTTDVYTNVFPICGCATSFTVTSSGSSDINSWSVVQDDAGTVGTGTSQVVNAPLSCTVLPVELTSFEAAHNGRSVELTWQTASEQNNDHFIVEKSEDLMNWVFVDKVNGVGNSTSSNSYITHDHSPYKKESYYRLKQTDFDGSHEYSENVFVRSSMEDDYTVFPNPFTSSLHIVFESVRKQSTSITLTDLSGRECYSSKVNVKKGVNNIEALTAELEKGVYNLKVTLEDEAILLKVVKQ